MTNALPKELPISSPIHCTLLRLPTNLILEVMSYLNVQERNCLKLVGRHLRQLVDEYPNYVWRQLFRHSLPPCVIEETPKRWLENGKARQTYEECCQILTNLNKCHFHFTLLNVLIPNFALSCFEVGYRRLYAAQTNGQVFIWDKQKTFQALQLPPTGASIYDLGSTADYLTVASKNGQLAIWKKDNDDQLCWVQTLELGELTTLFVSENIIFEQTKTNPDLHLWKPCPQTGLFQTIQKIERVRKILFMDDFFVAFISGVGLEVRSQERLLKTIPTQNPQFWLAGPYLCLYIETGLEIWKKIGEKLFEIALLPLKKGISDITIWDEYLSIQYYETNMVVLLEIFNKFNLVRTLWQYTDYFFCDKILFAQVKDSFNIHVWQKQGPFVKNVQTLSLTDQLTNLVLYHQSLFILTNDKTITMYRKDNKLEFKFLKVLRSEGPKISELHFKSGFLIALTVEPKVEIWDFTSL